MPFRVLLDPENGGSCMSIVVRFNPTMTREEYDQGERRLEAAGIWPHPDGLALHVLFGSAEDLRVSEIWDSREQLEAFGDQLMPILADIGVELAGEPEIFEVHNLIKR
jgi:hypothetical protein